MSRTILVMGDKTFKIVVPDDAKLTFGPFSPPTRDRADAYMAPGGKAMGTLRVYQGTEKNILACFSGVTGFRDLSLGYAEQVAREEGATIWRDDEKGYTRDSKVTQSREWLDDPVVETPRINGRRPARTPKS